MRNPNGFDFKDLMTFGLFILALLTFVLRFVSDHTQQKPPLYFGESMGGNANSQLLVNPLWAVALFCVYNIAYLRFDCKSHLT